MINSPSSGRWNSGAQRMYGWKKEEAIRKISHQLLQSRFAQPLAGSGGNRPVDRERLVHLLHGEIGFQSEVGKGSAFVLFLPYRVNGK